MAQSRLGSLSLCLLLLLLGDVTRGDLAQQLRAQGRSMVLVGGGLEDDNLEVYNTIVSMAGGRGQARIGIVTASSADPNDSYQFYRGLLLSDPVGAASTLHINVSIWDSTVANDPALAAQVRTLTGFFFSGGDQSRVTQAMFLAGRVDTPVLAAIRETFLAGAVVAGSSAGTACHPTPVMVTGGVSFASLKYGAHPTETHRDVVTYNPDGGLGFFDGYVIDTHFANRGREGRMIRLLSDTKNLPKGTARGFGVDENTALVVTHLGTPQAVGSVIGTGGVTFFDLTSSFVDTSQRDFSIRDVYLAYLTHGDEYKFDSNDVSFAVNKMPIKGRENYDRALTSNDVFYGKNASSTRKPEFVRVAASIFDSRLDVASYGVTYERNPRFRVDMSKSNSHAAGFVKRNGDFHSDLHSYKGLYVAIHAE